MRKITVVITTWHVPFDQVLNGVHHFDHTPQGIADATALIDAESLKWWLSVEGDRSVDETGDKHNERREPLGELGYNHARYTAWGGEAGFQAMIDAESYGLLHEAHYAGKPLPGYLVNSYLAGRKPGAPLTDIERAELEQQQAMGFAAIEAYYSKHTKQ